MNSLPSFTHSPSPVYDPRKPLVSFLPATTPKHCLIPTFRCPSHSFLINRTALNHKERLGGKAHRLAPIMGNPVVHEPDANRYAIYMEGSTEPAVLRYNVKKIGDEKVYDLTHTYVTPAMRGKGAAAELVSKAISHAREDNHKIIPTCSYIVAHMRNRAQYQDVLHQS